MGTIPYRKKKSEKDVTFLMSMKLNRKEFTSSNVFMSNSLSGYRRKAVPEAVFRRCSVKNVFLKISQNSQENTSLCWLLLLFWETLFPGKKLWKSPFELCLFNELDSGTVFYLKNFWHIAEHLIFKVLHSDYSSGHRKCSVLKKLFSKISQVSQKIPVLESLFNNVPGL